MDDLERQAREGAVTAKRPAGVPDADRILSARIARTIIDENSEIFIPETDALAAVRDALMSPAPQAEPAAWMYVLHSEDGHPYAPDFSSTRWEIVPDDTAETPLYAAPQPPVDLEKFRELNEPSGDSGELDSWTNGYVRGYRSALSAAASRCEELTVALDNAGKPYRRPASADQCVSAIRDLYVPGEEPEQARRLHDAAPAMMKALQWAVDNPQDDAYWITQARAAIAQAGGEAQS
jgi:hypothetical protein